MAGVAQSVRAPGCGSGGRRFDSGHSPHFLAIVLLFFSCALNANDPKIARSEPLIKLPSPVEIIIPPDISLKPHTKKPSLTLIVDEFSARADWSKIILASLPSKTILSVASHLPFNIECIKNAIDFGFTIAISVDYITKAQWQILQKAILQLNEELKKIDSNACLQGVIVWRVSNEEDFQTIMQTMKNWLTSNNMWLVYANISNILPLQTLPPGVLNANGFVMPTDHSQHVTDTANFVLSQAKYNGKGIMLVKPAKQHFKKLSDWLQTHAEDISLENWHHKK
jgi:hypothetical protein